MLDLTFSSKEGKKVKSDCIKLRIKGASVSKDIEH
jgi:hypothetical protein